MFVDPRISLYRSTEMTLRRHADDAVATDARAKLSRAGKKERERITARYMSLFRANGTQMKQPSAAATGITYLSGLSKSHLCEMLCIKDELSAAAVNELFGVFSLYLSEQFSSRATRNTIDHRNWNERFVLVSLYRIHIAVYFRCDLEGGSCRVNRKVSRLKLTKCFRVSARNNHDSFATEMIRLGPEGELGARSERGL